MVLALVAVTLGGNGGVLSVHGVEGKKGETDTEVS